MRHHKTDPAGRAEDIANRESKMLESDRYHKGKYPYPEESQDEWVEFFDQSLIELTGGVV